MRYIRPGYYDDFKCIADKCPDTCCAGWQIMIDEDSLEKYVQVKDDFGQRLRNSIDWQEGAFFQNSNRRCAFLNDCNLCDLYTELGSEALCDTCRNYPRHVEEYEGLREWSLSLSCPVAAEIILSEQGFPRFIEVEDDREDELEEEFEEFDLLMFTQLEDARAIILEHLEKTGGTLEDKMASYLQLAEEMQDCVNREAYFEIEEVVYKYKEQRSLPLSPMEERYSHMTTLYAHIIGLERLRDEWSRVLEQLEKTLYADGREAYFEYIREWEAHLAEDAEAARQWENVGTRLFVFFLYTYFCGAVYDDWIYSKMALAVESVRFIRELYIARWVQTKKLQMEDCAELAYRYAREIEHSDQNLNELEEIFMKKIPS